MIFYTIQNNNLLTADKKEALTRFYNNILPLPLDYENGKYIVQDGKLVKNYNWEKEQEEKDQQKTIENIKSELTNLDIKRIRAICENEIKDETTGETWIEYYNNQAVELRKQLNNL